MQTAKAKDTNHLRHSRALTIQQLRVPHEQLENNPLEPDHQLSRSITLYTLISHWRRWDFATVSRVSPTVQESATASTMPKVVSRLLMCVLSALSYGCSFLRRVNKPDWRSSDPRPACRPPSPPCGWRNPLITISETAATFSPIPLSHGGLARSFGAAKYETS